MSGSQRGFQMVEKDRNTRIHAQPCCGNSANVARGKAVTGLEANKLSPSEHSPNFRRKFVLLGGQNTACAPRSSATSPRSIAA
jgi:hypothetical protein